LRFVIPDARLAVSPGPAERDPGANAPEFHFPDAQTQDRFWIVRSAGSSRMTLFGVRQNEFLHSVVRQYDDFHSGFMPAACAIFL
jgi:hypothetical protein